MAKQQYDEQTIIVRDKIYIPVDAIDVERAENAYTHFMYDDKACVRCENRSQRHNYVCDNCEAFKGAVTTCKRTVKNGIDYIGVPIGDRLKVEKKVGFDMDEFTIVDKRVRQKFDYNIKMIDFKLRDHQQEAEDAWYEIKHGLIVAPPRSGKTPTMLHIMIRGGYRSLLLANQHDFLQQFVEHIEEYTNLPRLQDKYGVKLYGFPKKIEDFDTLQIAVCTYQQFISEKNGKLRYAAAKRNFGSVWVDEVHKANSNEFARIVNGFPALYRGGVTGTDKRKDGRHILVQEIIGPVAKRIVIDQLQAKVFVHICDYVKSKSRFQGPAGFVYACKFLANHEKRMEEILSWVEKDLEKGHNIVIPVYYKDHVNELVKRINSMMGEKIAEGFMGGGGKKNKEQREAIIDRARKNKTRVVVGIRSIIQLGLNVPTWSCLYYIMPMSNEPNWKQESSRILTPMEGKRDPIIRMFVDPNIGLSLGCFVSTYKSTLKFKHLPTAPARERALEMFELQGAGRRGMEEAEGLELDYEADDKYRGREKGNYTSKSNKKEKEEIQKGLFSRMKKLGSKKK